MYSMSDSNDWLRTFISVGLVSIYAIIFFNGLALDKHTSIHPSGYAEIISNLSLWRMSPPLLIRCVLSERFLNGFYSDFPITWFISSPKQSEFRQWFCNIQVLAKPRFELHLDDFCEIGTVFSHPFQHTHGCCPQTQNLQFSSGFPYPILIH